MVSNTVSPIPLTTLTFAQYLHHNDGTDTRYELVRGLLLPMTPAFCLADWPGCQWWSATP
jgi:Uma2 family endonuclease